MAVNVCPVSTFEHIFCVCVQNNGGCSKHARCEYMGQGQRNCSCYRGFMGDGFDCRGNTQTVSHTTSDLPLTSAHTLSCPPTSTRCCVVCFTGAVPKLGERLLPADVNRESLSFLTTFSPDPGNQQ